jgi:hypothetical protein
VFDETIRAVLYPQIKTKKKNKHRCDIIWKSKIYIF